MEAQVQDRATGDIATDTLWRGLTPHGRPYEMTVRPGTSDWNTVNACAHPHDEYHLPEGLSGWALDVGAHIGACAIPLLLDNPDLWLVAIEALPENVDMLRANADRNGVTDRLHVMQAAASSSPTPVAIAYPDDREHRFIGNADHPSGPGPHEMVMANGVTLGLLVDHYPGEAHGFGWMKIDCEGCEYPFLSSPATIDVAVIVGEHHRGIDGIRELLTFHDVELVTGTEGFGTFRAVRRATSPLTAVMDGA